MPRHIFNPSLFAWTRSPGRLAFVLAVLSIAPHVTAQNTPLLSGGVGFFTTTNGGNTTYQPIIEPLLVAPIGPRVLVESRATLTESFSPKPDSQGGGYDHSHFIALTYLQADYVASSHFTIIAGSFLLPFGSFNERLSPLWINNFQDGPIVSVLGLLSTGSGLGAQLRGSAISRRQFSIDYATYYCARSGNEQLNSERSLGARGNLYLPVQRLELGLSYNRRLQETHENFYSAHLWWEPKDTGLRLRTEFDRGHHAQGYWLDADYRLQVFVGPDTFIGRFEPVFRMQQTFRRDTIVSDSLPLVNTQRADFGLDYNLPHNTRILSSYSRQFSANGNRNIWETGIVYRFLFPAWKGK